MSLLNNLVWGVRGGLVFGVVYSVWAGVLFLLGGSAPFRGYNITVIEAMAVYLLGGAAAGAVVGILRPLTRWKLGAAVVGIIAAVPLSIGIIGTMKGFLPWTETHTFVVTTLAILLGGGGGLILHEIYSDDSGNTKPESEGPTRSRQAKVDGSD